MVYFTQCNAVQFLPCCHSFRMFFPIKSWMTFSCVSVLHFTYWFIHWLTLKWFYVLAIVNSSALNMAERASLQLISNLNYPEGGFVGNSFLIFFRPPYSSTQSQTVYVAEWSWTSDPPSSSPQMLGVLTCAATLSSPLKIFCSYCMKLCFTNMSFILYTLL